MGKDDYLLIIIIATIALIMIYVSVTYRNVGQYFFIIFILVTIYRIFVLPAQYESNSRNELPNLIKNRIKERKFIRSTKVELLSYERYSTLIAITLTALCIVYYTGYINSKFNQANGIQDIFLITLTFILVYATLSLLSFTYTMVLRNEERKEIIELAFKKDTSLQHKIEMEILNELSKYKKEARIAHEEEEKIKEKVEKRKLELEKSYHVGTTNNMLRINQENQLKYRNAGQAFFMATLFSGLGFLFIYTYFIFSSVEIVQGTIFYSIRHVITTYGLIPLFHFFTLFILSFSAVNFLRGLVIAFRALIREIPY